MTPVKIAFWGFLLVVFAIYYLPVVRKRVAIQNLWLLFASVVFYGLADLRMLPLLVVSILLFYILGNGVSNSVCRKDWARASLLEALGIVCGVAVLAWFKCAGLFTSRHPIVPIGISFYTFRLMSYVIELKRGKIEKCRSIVDFALYVSFFPTLLSGPIDRPGKFIPQLSKVRDFDYGMAVDGCRQILWGLFLKLCVADNLSTVTDNVWNGIAATPSSVLWVVFLFYPLQLYADFCGYSDIAIGVGKLLGIRVARNFNHPFLARNVAEYWRNWHISLTKWLTDYVFTPLSVRFRNLGNAGTCLSIIITFVLIGLWHGIDWTYGLFGLYHGILFIPLILSGSFNRKKKLQENRFGLPRASDFIRMCGVWLLVAFGLILFRAPSLHEAAAFCSGMAAMPDGGLMGLVFALKDAGARLVSPLFLLLVLLLEWKCRKQEYPLQFSAGSRPAVSIICRTAVYVALACAIIICQGGHESFVYFQF